MTLGARAAQAAVLVALLTTTGAGCGPDDTTSAPPAGPVVEERSARLAVPAGYVLQTMEFGDATHGYISYVEESMGTGKGDRHGSLLFATVDGGRTWRPLTDPRQPSESPQLYVVNPRVIVLLAEPFGWYVSRDGGATFEERRRLEPAPPELDSLRGPYAIDCPASGCRVQGPGATQPGLPGDLGAVAPAGDQVWAVSLKAGTVHTAVGPTATRWQRHAVPAHPGGVPVRVDLRVSPDGADVWLVGYVGSPGGQLGSVAPRRRKDVGVPLLWRFDGGRWLGQGTENAPTPRAVPYAVTAVGGGLVAAAGPDGLALVDTAWRAVALTPAPEWVTTLPDATIVAAATSNGTVYLGRRTGREIEFVRVTVRAQ